MSVYRIKSLSIRLWIRACEYDGTDPALARVEFSPGNPHAEAARRGSALLARAWRGRVRRLPR